jgi:uncharacterized membrane protein YqjE
MEVTPLMNANPIRVNDRSLADILAEIKSEFQAFVQTRIELLRAEMREKARVIKAAVPLAAIGVMFLGVAFVLFSLALVGLVVAAFGGSPYRWFFAFLIISVLWLIFGAVAALVAKQQLSAKSIVPRKTIQVLNNDKAWLQREAKNIL